jgi:hypothetical protein
MCNASYLATIAHLDKLLTFVSGYHIVGSTSGTPLQTVQGRQCTYDVAMKGVRVTIGAISITYSECVCV